LKDSALKISQAMLYLCSLSSLYRQELTQGTLMFDFMFGGKKKLNLIRELLEQRMMDEGYGASPYKLQIKQMGNLELMSTPEGALVTILETVMRLQRKGVLLAQILSDIEKHRAKIGHEPDRFDEIIRVATSAQHGMAVPLYVQYRIDLEHPNLLTEEQLEHAASEAVDALVYII